MAKEMTDLSGTEAQGTVNKVIRFDKYAYTYLELCAKQYGLSISDLINCTFEGGVEFDPVILGEYIIRQAQERARQLQDS